MDTTLTLADICCGAGLGADGYAAVGFEPTGWDLYTQPDYPYTFVQGDALAFLRSDEPERYDALHSSFPCQLFTRAKHLRTAQGGRSKEKVDLLTPGLALLRERWSHKPWVVENVDSRETRAIMQPREGEWLTRLCGSSFRLGVQRHRLFLTNFPVEPLACDHSRFEPDPITGKPRPWGVYHVKGDNVPSGGRTALSAEHGREVMGSRRLLPWDSLKEGFPPAYASYIGVHLRLHLARPRQGQPHPTPET